VFVFPRLTAQVVRVTVMAVMRVLVPGIGIPPSAMNELDAGDAAAIGVEITGCPAPDPLAGRADRLTGDMDPVM